MNIRTLIVDDELLARERIRRMLEDESDVEILGECVGGRQAVSFIEEHAPDLVFLDIQMPEMSGFEVLETISPQRMPAIIFVTAYDRYALKAFEVHALDYLLKPVGGERLSSALRQAREQIKNARLGRIDERVISLLNDLHSENRYLKRVILKSIGRLYFIKTEEIDWIEGAGNYVKLHVAGKAHMLRERMNTLETKLNPEVFVRVHRSTIINVERIEEMRPLFNGDYTVTLSGGVEVVLSRSRRDRLLRLLEKTS
ncbi:MAG TPA: LytTR family DNA-binding domain-containing protein [Pyrinomonadaceae bacterium]